MVFANLNILFQALTPIELFRWAKLNLDQKHPRFGGKAGFGQIRFN